MAMIFTACLVVLLVWISVIDLRSFRIPDDLNAALCGFGLLWAGWSGLWLTGLLGGLAGLGGPLLIRFLYSKLRGRQGLGLGDVKFLGAAGVWVGWDGLPVLLMIASISALAMTLIYAVKGRETGAGSRIAFGPHLSLALFAVWVAKAFELV